MRIARWSAVVLISSVLAAVGGGCNSPSRPASQGIVLITVDAVNPSRLALYGGPVESPNLGRLAESATVYDDAVSVSPMTRPAAVTLLSGIAPDRSGVRSDVADAVGAEIATLPRLMGARGRATLGLVTTPLLSYSSGLHRDFDLFDGPDDILFGLERFFPAPRDPAELAGSLSSWLSALPADQPFFAWVHLAAAHGESTATLALEDTLAYYDAALDQLDQSIGAIVEAVDGARADGTAIVVSGTYSAALNEGFAPRGGSYWLRDDTLRVPLLIRGPGFPAGQRSSERVWLPDVARTLAGLAGVTLTGSAEGIDLSDNGLPPVDRARMAWTWAPDDELAWPTLTAAETGDGNWHVVPWTELEAAPDAAPEPVRARPATPRRREIPATLERQLIDAGLIEGWQDATSREYEQFDDTGRDDFLVKLQVIRHRLLPGAEAVEHRRGARRLIQELRALNSTSLAVISTRLYWRAMAGSSHTTRTVREQALALYPTRAEVLHLAGHTYLADGDTGSGELLLQAALEMTGPDPDIMYDLACTRAVAGDSDQALARLAQALDAGFRNWDHIDVDPDLATIREDPRFAPLMERQRR